MRLICCVLSLSLFLSACAFSADTTLPIFADYPATQTGEPTLTAIDFSSHPDAPMFRTNLEYQLNQPANFAGHYILTYWGCGTGCQYIAVIDVLNGQVFMPGLASSYGVCFQTDSALLITNPIDEFLLEGFDELPDWLNTGYYEWNGQDWRLLAESRDIIAEDCDL